MPDTCALTGLNFVLICLICLICSEAAVISQGIGLLLLLSGCAPPRATTQPRRRCRRSRKEVVVYIAVRGQRNNTTMQKELEGGGCAHCGELYIVMSERATPQLQYGRTWKEGVQSGMTWNAVWKDLEGGRCAHHGIVVCSRPLQLLRPQLTSACSTCNCTTSTSTKL